MTGFRKHLMDRHPLPPCQHPIPDDDQLPPKWILQPKSDAELAADGGPRPTESDAAPTDEYPGLTHLDYDLRPLPDTLTATLTENRRVTPQKHWQDVRRISLTLLW